MQTLQIVSNDALRSSIQSVHKSVLNYWQSYEHYEMQLYVFRSWVVQSWIITPAFWISVDKKIVSVGKEHTTYVIFPINSWEFPPVETFFDMNFSGNNPANYNLQGYSKSETHSTREAKTVESNTPLKSKTPLLDVLKVFTVICTKYTSCILQYIFHITIYR